MVPLRGSISYYTGAVTEDQPVTGYPNFRGQSYRSYGAPFAALGSLRAEWPGDPSSPLSMPRPPAVPAFTWTGSYLGGQIGYAWGNNNSNVVFAAPGGLFGNNPLGNDAQGVIGGGHAGYSLQISQWMFGIEGTADGTTMSRNVLVLAPDLADPTGVSAGTVTGAVRSDI